MVKKIVATGLAIIICTVYFVMPSFALAQEVSLAEQTWGLLNEMDELYEKRAQLVLNFEDNIDEIRMVDAQLQNLGVKTLSTAEATELIQQGGARGIDVQSTSYTTWTSLETVYPYMGRFFEIQVITGVPRTFQQNGDTYLDTRSSLYDSEMHVVSDVDIKPKYDKAFQIMVDGAVTQLLSSVTEGAPYVSEVLAIGKTFYEMYGAVMGSVASSSTLYDVECTYDISMNTTMKLIYIKPKDSSLYNPILGYGGNMTYCSIVTGLTTGLVVEHEDGLYSEREYYTTYNKLQSPYYHNAYDKAAANWIQYENRFDINQIEDTHYVRVMELKCFVNKNGTVEDKVNIVLPCDSRPYA